MIYKRSEFKLDKPEAALLELPSDENYHTDQIGLLETAITQIGETIAARSIEEFEILRAEGFTIEEAFDLFDISESQVRVLLTMGLVVSTVLREFSRE